MATAPRSQRDRARALHTGVEGQGETVDLLNLRLCPGGIGASSAGVTGEGDVGLVKQQDGGGTRSSRSCGSSHVRDSGHNRSRAIVRPRAITTRPADELKPKPGKQRLGPRTKKLSSLKKIILLDKAERWRQLKVEFASSRDGGGVVLAGGSVVGANARSSGGGGGGSSSNVRKNEEDAAESEEVACETPARSSSTENAHRAIQVEGSTKDTDRVGAVDGLDEVYRLASLGPSISDDRSSRKHWVVVIHHMVAEEDVEDDEEHEEILQNLSDMSSTFGTVRHVHVPRKGQEGLGTAVVAFDTLAAATDARAGFHGQVVAGQTLEAELVQDTDALLISPHLPVRESLPTTPPGRSGGAAASLQQTPQSQAPALMQAEPRQEFTFQRDHVNLMEDDSGRGDDNFQGGHVLCNREGMSTAPPTPAPARSWRVVVRNMVDKEDILADDEEYDEVFADAAAMVGEYGNVLALNIPRGVSEAGACGTCSNPGDSGRDAETTGVDTVGVVTAVFGSMVEADACIKGLRGRIIGGKALEAELCASSPPLLIEALSPPKVPPPTQPPPSRRDNTHNRGGREYSAVVPKVPEATTDPGDSRAQHGAPSSDGSTAIKSPFEFLGHGGSQIHRPPIISDASAVTCGGDSGGDAGVVVSRPDLEGEKESDRRRDSVAKRNSSRGENAGGSDAEGVSGAAAVARNDGTVCEALQLRGKRLKRMPEKYREAAALPRLPPSSSDAGAAPTRTYINQVGGAVRPWCLFTVGS